VIVVDGIDVLINEAGKRGFRWHLFRVDENGPEVLAGVLQWPSCADVVVLIDDHKSHAYRVRTVDPDVEVFAPVWVHWFYGLALRWE
jgi:ferric iron reductase protein FhuF